MGIARFGRGSSPSLALSLSLLCLSLSFPSWLPRRLEVSSHARIFLIDFTIARPAFLRLPPLALPCLAVPLPESHPVVSFPLAFGRPGGGTCGGGQPSFLVPFGRLDTGMLFFLVRGALFFPFPRGFSQGTRGENNWNVPCLGVTRRRGLSCGYGFNNLRICYKDFDSWIHRMCRS